MTAVDLGAASTGELDVARLRRETPGVEDHIHFNNAGAALPSAAVVERQIAHLRLEARIGGYRAARQVSEEVDRLRQSIAGLVGARSDEVALHQSATDAWNTAVLAFLQRAHSGDRVLVDGAVYGSHAITLLHNARARGVVVVPIQSGDDGEVDLHHLEAELEHPRTTLVCATHIATSSGTVQPIEAVGEACAQRGVDLVVDACQSLGQWPVHMGRIGCSALAGTGRKFLRGPRGTGFLVLRRAAFKRFPPIAPDLRAARWTSPLSFQLADDARRYESWERNVAAMLGLGVAIEHTRSLSVPVLSQRIQLLAARLRAGLARVDGVTVRDIGRRLCGICTFDVEGATADVVARRLQDRGVTVSVSRATSAQLDLGERGLSAVVRASVHAYNTADEIDAAVVHLRRVCGD